ncbi:hypothetical protein GCM10010185_06030 [Saccharothrix coeruleofusca]|uniref:Uncharacterized protein n=1 Tax=Saccharothrix coeruleofusca TaxID=33919 RepID=A0A918AGS3_9PSEU|nr:hypothetical protein [Saccharothrix coeruleofusca]MBP2340083.1 hypothetical protein [Saccharothrix coeruleofusca]GGP37458.1 hypothetical protein GCM10010185_06030 [Saccharothrix coeruleofusca]
MVLPNQPSTEGTALDDRWTQHCLERASRRAFGWTALGALAFLAQLLLVLRIGAASPLPVLLLAFSLAVVAWALRSRPPLPPLMADEPWLFARVHWRNGRLVVHGTRPLVLDVRGAGPLVRGRIRRHRRAWLVRPDPAGNTVVAFRGVPRLFPAEVLRAPAPRARRRSA